MRTATFRLGYARLRGCDDRGLEACANEQHAAKTSVLIVDFVDTGHPALVRMWERRQRGYRAMAYRW